MGTAVYLDEGTVETNADAIGQDVRFHSSLCWAWWPSLAVEDTTQSIECIDGVTGLRHVHTQRSILSNSKDQTQEGGTIKTATLDAKKTDTSPTQQDEISLISTQRLFDLNTKMAGVTGHAASANKAMSLHDLRAHKLSHASEYENAKTDLLEQHRVFRTWRRRENYATSIG
mmetsp:Transcript_1622/g.4441  ORF Transcript_1622/g.4441 Transcript_1622/m.4441 type:complete len:172 (-) Transcript_1622:257-772(-)